MILYDLSIVFYKKIKKILKILQKKNHGLQFRGFSLKGLLDVKMKITLFLAYTISYATV